MEWLQITWFGLIAFFFCGYSILDGFDLGVGVLSPFLARTDIERSALYSSIGPFWDGNEVWLLAGGGALFAAFPPVYATVFSGFYLVLMMLLFALIFRAVSLEFWSHSDSGRNAWNAAFMLGSLIPALLFGVALGNVLQGVPLDANQDFAGSFFSLLRPFPLVLGFFGLAAFMMHGAVYAGLKTEGPVRERACRAVKTLAVPTAGLWMLSILLAVLTIPSARSIPAAWVSSAVALLLQVAAAWRSEKGKMGQAFFASSLFWVALWLTAAFVQFPVLLRSSDGLNHLTVFTSSSSTLTLKVTLVIALAGMPLVVAYTVYVYRALGRKHYSEDKPVS